MGIGLILLLQASVVQGPSAGVQGPSPVPSVGPPRPDYPASGAGPSAQSPLGASGITAAPPDPGLTTPAALQPPPPVFVRRTGPLCSDFTPAPGAGWTAAASVEFPGPRGPLQLTLGQAVQPGDYVQGLDLGSILQRDCPRTVAPRPPTG